MPKMMRLDGLVRIPWSAAEQAYRWYAEFCPGSVKAQSLTEIDRRGGFGIQEFACLYSGHRPGHAGRQVERLACIAKAFMDVGVGGDRT